MINKFKILSEYEYGRSQMAIEWVARAQKPIAEIGGCLVKNCDFRALAYDLNLCIKKSGESVRAFIMPDRIRGYCFYGFYRYPWTIKALLFAWGIKSIPDPAHSDWIQGLLFGYSSEAIQRFILSRRHGQASNLHHCLGIQFFHLGKVEIYGPLASIFRPCNNQSGKCQKPR